jgi:CheY-like chemotaxis protein
MTTANSSSLSLPPISQWVVLIVDDQADNLIVSSTALEFQGAKVVTATNGVEGLEKLNQLHPTVVLMDLSMPKMDGWEALRHIRNNPQTATTPVIALTAHAMGGDKERILEAGFNGYIAKPFEVFGLVEDIQRVLAGRLPSQG